jgi:hypothetical protein
MPVKGTIRHVAIRITTAFAVSVPIGGHRLFITVRTRVASTLLHAFMQVAVTKGSRPGRTRIAIQRGVVVAIAPGSTTAAATA